MDELLWTEKYRPKTVSECIIPETMKKEFMGMIETGGFPNLLLAGGQGQGKTTLAKALCDELNCTYFLNNSSDERGIGTIRNTLKDYASTVALDGRRKVVILDEADNLTPDAQSALRGFMEQYSANCGFILTCNYLSKIMEPIKSRCAVVQFNINREKHGKLALLFSQRVMAILKEEKVQFNTKVVLTVVDKYFPDFRRTINELQRYSKHGNEIDTGILAQIDEYSLDTLFANLKAKKFNTVREWIAANSHSNADELYGKIYRSVETKVTQESFPSAILVLQKYQQAHPFSADPELCLLACMTEMMLPDSGIIWR